LLLEVQPNNVLLYLALDCEHRYPSSLNRLLCCVRPLFHWHVACKAMESLILALCKLADDACRMSWCIHQLM
jgi:hypothetical protein